jgi:hypothetical protein
MALQDEIADQLQCASMGIPWVLGVSTGEITKPDEISAAQLAEGQGIVISELIAVVKRLAGEIDRLNAGHDASR